jgi:flagellar biosynthetic protein FliR
VSPLDHQATALALETTRIVGALIVAPTPIQNAPVRARAALAILLAFVVHSTTAGHPPLFDSWLRVVIAAPGEMLLGVAMGMTFRLALASVEIASEAFGPMIGFGLASLFDPKTQSQESALARMLRMFAMLLAVIAGVHRVLIGSLLASFRAIPVGMVVAPQATAIDLVSMTGESIAFGLRLALPLLSILLLGQLALAFISRAAPQLGIFGVGFAVSAMLGAFVLIASLNDYASAVLFELGRVGGWIEIIIRSAQGA